MIFQQNAFQYIISLILFIVLYFRLYRILQLEFNKMIAVIFPLVFLLHPINLESLLAPNYLSGSLAFWLLLEGMQIIRSNQNSNIEKLKCMLLITASASLNIHYALIPIYFGSKLFYKQTMGKVLLTLYFLVVVLYCCYNFLGFDQNYLNTLSLYTLNTLAPLQSNFFSYALYPGNLLIYLFSTLIILGLVVYLFKKREFDNIAILSLICLTIPFKNFNLPQQFWSNLLGNHSAYMYLSFLFLLFILRVLKNRIFIVFSIFWIYISLVSIPNFFPASKYIDTSFQQLPENFLNFKDAQKVLAWQFLAEGNKQAGTKIIQQLIIDYPADKELQDQLNAIPDN